MTALFVLLGGTQAISGAPTTYLQPEDGFWVFAMLNPYYEAVSERLLSSSQNRKCQAVFLPSFSEESAVYLTYDDKNPMAPPIVVSLKFERQLWADMHRLMESSADAKGAYSVRADAQLKALSQIRSVVNRFEAPIDKRVAVVLERAWDALLRRVRYPEKAELGLDGESCHFANFASGFGYRTGWVWSPKKGTLSYDFVEIAKALREYPRLRGIDRKDLAQAMLKKAQKLLLHLKGNK